MSSPSRRADPAPARGRPAVRRTARRARRRSRRRARRAPRDPRPQRRREDDAVQPHLRRHPADLGDDRVPGQDSARSRRRARTRLGMGRTYQKSRLFLGLCVEDNLYLAVLGSREGHLRPVPPRPPTARCASAPASWPRSVGLENKIGDLVGSTLPRRAASAGGRHGARHRAEAHAARRARLRALARRARGAHRPAARARQEHHADHHRARHGRRPAGRRAA